MLEMTVGELIAQEKITYFRTAILISGRQRMPEAQVKW